jgi:hypothetical protein
LKTPKGGNHNPYIENRTDNTMAKRKSAKRQTTIYKTYIHVYKTKDRVTRTPLKTGDELGCSGRVRQFLLH